MTHRWFAEEKQIFLLPPESTHGQNSDNHAWKETLNLS